MTCPNTAVQHPGSASALEITEVQHKRQRFICSYCSEKWWGDFVHVSYAMEAQAMADEDFEQELGLGGRQPGRDYHGEWRAKA